MGGKQKEADQFFCSACKSGPWHNTWAAHERRSFFGHIYYVMPPRPIGGCCSGAD